MTAVCTLLAASCSGDTCRCRSAHTLLLILSMCTVVSRQCMAYARQLGTRDSRAEQQRLHCITARGAGGPLSSSDDHRMWMDRLCTALHASKAVQCSFAWLIRVQSLSLLSELSCVTYAEEMLKIYFVSF